MRAGFILLILTVFMAAGCIPVKKERRLAYCLAAEFNQNGKENRSEICNVVEIGERTEIAGIVYGPSNTCRANASGVAIPVERGDIVMLIDRQAGDKPPAAACAFGLRYEEKESELNEAMMPRFVFVPTGGPLKSAVEVGYQGLGEYQINNLRVLIEENVNDPVTYDEAFLKRFGCSFESLEGRYTSSPPACNSLATYQIPIPYPPFE